MRYEVQGIDEHGNGTVLHDGNSYNDARGWAQGYVRSGDYGSWSQLHLVDTTASAASCLMLVWDPETGERKG